MIYNIKDGKVSVSVKDKVFTVDYEDIDLINKYKYNIRKDNYVIRGTKTKYIHRDIYKKILGRDLNFNEKIDHIDRNPLNNERNNLRLVTNQENAFNQGLRTDNTSGVKGVYWSKKSGWWCANISINNKTIYLGHFNSKEDATKVRKEAEKKYHKIKSRKIKKC